MPYEKKEEIFHRKKFQRKLQILKIEDYRRPNIQIIGVPKEDQQSKGTEIMKPTIQENFLKLKRDLK